MANRFERPRRQPEHPPDPKPVRDEDWTKDRLAEIQSELEQRGSAEAAEEVAGVIETVDYVTSQPKNHTIRWYLLWDQKTTTLKPATRNKIFDAFAPEEGRFYEEVRPGQGINTSGRTTLRRGMAKIEQSSYGRVFLRG